MSRKPLSLSPDLKRLRDEGYDLDIRNGYLLVRDVPYVNSKREVKRGTLVMKLELAGDIADKPDNHVTYFDGDHPCHADGAEVSKIKHGSNQQTLAEGVVVRHSFSAKPQPEGNYTDYYHKVSTYVAMFQGPARQIDPSMTAKTQPAISTDEGDNSVFNYIDTASSRAEIVMITKKLEAKKVAIIGTGGTGAYVLDFVAKTPVGQIHLFDKDGFRQHNAFRAPGAPSLAELQAKPSKVAYLKGIYEKMHRGIVPHEAFLTKENVEELRGMDFAFICIDEGSDKKMIIAKLEEFGTAFVDVGMGIYEAEGTLGGTLRVTTSTPENREAARTRIGFSNDDGDNEYARNIQIAELNALNAALAVIKWKKLCGFYHDFDQEHSTTFTINGNFINNADKKQ
jgi:hypothetical protein